MTWGHFFRMKPYVGMDGTVIAQCSCGWSSALAFGGRNADGTDLGEHMAWQTFKRDHLERIAVQEAQT